MILSLRNNKNYKRKKTIKFLILPLFYRYKIYWLETVEIVKNFNGIKYQITSIKRIK